MKLVCYGASVTAQKDKGGYFSHLDKLVAECGVTELERIVFGASHFDYAGFGFFQEVLNSKPDICVIDWLTPSMKLFSSDKIKCVNNKLIEIGCIPIWVNFPRADDLLNERPCYKQVTDACMEAGIEFWDLSALIVGFKNRPEQFLRDVVHTNSNGAQKYAEILVEKLKWMLSENKNYKKCNSIISDLPNVIMVEKEIIEAKSFTLMIKKSHEDDLEILLKTIVGPNSCLFSILLCRGENLIDSKLINPTDPWCYYERDMVLPSIIFKVGSGNYQLKFVYQEGNPLENINLRQPLKNEELSIHNRKLKLNKLSINANVLT